MGSGALSGTGQTFIIGTTGASSGGSSNVNYSGTITSKSGSNNVVAIKNKTGGTVTFTGQISGTHSGTGVLLDTNTGATIRFSGGLTLSTSSGIAFDAKGGGIVEVCDENPCNPAATGALVNTLTTTTGTALNVANTTIGENNLEFRRISSGGPASGIILNTTGAAGGLVVKGIASGADRCGGTVTPNAVGTAATIAAPVSAECTGGLIAAFAGIAEELRRQYNIGFIPFEEGRPGQRKEIKIRVARPNLIIRARDSYIVGPGQPVLSEK